MFANYFQALATESVENLLSNYCKLRSVLDSNVGDVKYSFLLCEALALFQQVNNSANGCHMYSPELPFLTKSLVLGTANSGSSVFSSTCHSTQTCCLQDF